MARLPSSPKGRQGYNSRPVKVRQTRQNFLIVCEGSKTEPYYFNEFRVPGRVIGLGVSPIQLVDEAQRLRDEGDYDQVWCVFDRDDWPIDNFSGAISKARKKGIKVAYTNEAFELWYLLHFNYHDTGIGREEYKSRLSFHLGKTYFKNSKTIYDELKPNVNNAIHNAELLLTQYDPSKPGADNPSTTVHLLVKEVLNFAR